MKEIFFIAGGRNVGGNTVLLDTETFDGTVWNSQLTENLPTTVYLNCIVKINSSSLISVSGSVKSNFQEYTKNTYLYNSHSNKWTSGPALKIQRNKLSCGLLVWNNPKSNKLEKVVVAVGGYGDDLVDLSSVELLYLNEDDTIRGEWVTGPEVPKAGYAATMVEYNNSVILIGGVGDDGVDGLLDGHHLYQLSSPNGPWIEMRQTLRKERDNFVSFLVPDELVNCHEYEF